jgi:stage II sporulation protein Q
MQIKRKLKPFVIPVLYGVVTISLLVSLMLLIQTITDVNDNPLTYVTASTLIDEVIPVINEKETITRPYTDKDIKVLKNYYDYKSDKTLQEGSLIYYENTYIQNSGVDYGRTEAFDVVSILSGKVIDIIEDDILGRIVEIQHTNDIIASYQCLGDVVVNKNDVLSQGQKIGTSGTCNISVSLGKHLHFEVTNKGEVINPENIYDKGIDEI